MQEIRNKDSKLVCQVDKETKTVVIVVKGCKTTLRFTDDGKIEVKHAKVTA